jgi:hypothetical protein
VFLKQQAAVRILADSFSFDESDSNMQYLEHWFMAKLNAFWKVVFIS